METLPKPLRTRLMPFTPDYFPTLENRVRRMLGSGWWSDIEEPFAWVPTVDLVDRDGELLLTAELPGMKKEDVEIDLANNVLTIKGEKHEKREEEKGQYRISERHFGSFERSFVVPTSVNMEEIVADFEDGILTVHLPKQEVAKGRKIKIKDA